MLHVFCNLLKDICFLQLEWLLLHVAAKVGLQISLFAFGDSRTKLLIKQQVTAEIPEQLEIPAGLDV